MLKSSHRRFLRKPSVALLAVMMFLPTLVVSDGTVMPVEASSGICTFNDSFNGSVLDTDTWSTFGAPTLTVANGILSIGIGGSLDGVQSKFTFGPGTTFEARSEFTTNPHSLMLGVSRYPAFHGGPDNDALITYAGTLSYPQSLIHSTTGNGVGGYTVAPAQPSAGFHTWRIEWPESGPAKYYQDGQLQATHSHRPNSDDLRIHLGGNNYQGAFTVRYDRVSVWHGVGGENPCPDELVHPCQPTDSRSIGAHGTISPSSFSAVAGGTGSPHYQIYSGKERKFTIDLALPTGWTSPADGSTRRVCEAGTTTGTLPIQVAPDAQIGRSYSIKVTATANDGTTLVDYLTVRVKGQFKMQAAVSIDQDDILVMARILNVPTGEYLSQYQAWDHDLVLHATVYEGSSTQPITGSDLNARPWESHNFEATMNVGSTRDRSYRIEVVLRENFDVLDTATILESENPSGTGKVSGYARYMDGSTYTGPGWMALQARSGKEVSSVYLLNGWFSLDSRTSKQSCTECLLVLYDEKGGNEIGRNEIRVPSGRDVQTEVLILLDRNDMRDLIKSLFPSFHSATIKDAEKFLGIQDEWQKKREKMAHWGTANDVVTAAGIAVGAAGSVKSVKYGDSNYLKRDAWKHSVGGWAGLGKTADDTNRAFEEATADAVLHASGDLEHTLSIYGLGSHHNANAWSRFGERADKVWDALAEQPPSSGQVLLDKGFDDRSPLFMNPSAASYTHVFERIHSMSPNNAPISEEFDGIRWSHDVRQLKNQMDAGDPRLKMMGSAERDAYGRPVNFVVPVPVELPLSMTSDQFKKLVAAYETQGKIAFMFGAINLGIGVLSLFSGGTGVIIGLTASSGSGFIQSEAEQQQLSYQQAIVLTLDSVNSDWMDNAFARMVAYDSAIASFHHEPQSPYFYDKDMVWDVRVTDASWPEGTKKGSGGFHIHVENHAYDPDKGAVRVPVTVKKTIYEYTLIRGTKEISQNDPCAGPGTWTAPQSGCYNSYYECSGKRSAHSERRLGTVFSNVDPLEPYEQDSFWVDYGPIPRIYGCGKNSNGASEQGSLLKYHIEVLAGPKTIGDHIFHVCSGGGCHAKVSSARTSLANGDDGVLPVGATNVLVDGGGEPSTFTTNVSAQDRRLYLSVDAHPEASVSLYVLNETGARAGLDPASGNISQELIASFATSEPYNLRGLTLEGPTAGNYTIGIHALSSDGEPVPATLYTDIQEAGVPELWVSDASIRLHASPTGDLVESQLRILEGTGLAPMSDLQVSIDLGDILSDDITLLTPNELLLGDLGAGDHVDLSFALQLCPLQVCSLLSGQEINGTLDVSAVAPDGTVQNITVPISILVDGTAPEVELQVEPSPVDGVFVGPEHGFTLLTNDTHGIARFHYIGEPGNESISSRPYQAFGPSRNLTIQGYAVDLAGNQGLPSALDLTLDSTLPVVSLPTGVNDGIQVGRGTLIGLQAVDPGPSWLSSGIASIQCDVLGSGVAVLEDAQDCTGGLLLDVHDGIYRIEARAVDRVGNIGKPLVFNVSVDGTAPVIEVFGPAYGQTTISVGGQSVLVGQADSDADGYPDVVEHEAGSDVYSFLSSPHSMDHQLMTSLANESGPSFATDASADVRPVNGTSPLPTTVVFPGGDSIGVFGSGGNATLSWDVDYGYDVPIGVSADLFLDPKVTNLTVVMGQRGADLADGRIHEVNLERLPKSTWVRLEVPFEAFSKARGPIDVLHVEFSIEGEEEGAKVAHAILDRPVVHRGAEVFVGPALADTNTVWGTAGISACEQGQDGRVRCGSPQEVLAPRPVLTTIGGITEITMAGFDPNMGGVTSSELTAELLVPDGMTILDKEQEDGTFRWTLDVGETTGVVTFAADLMDGEGHRSQVIREFVLVSKPLPGL